MVHDGPHPDLLLELHLAAGQRHDLVLTLDTQPGAVTPDPISAWHAIEYGWSRCLPAAAELGTAARDVRHAHAVLHGLTSSWGAMVAAATLGLERAAADRNYDYRYAWIRDQCIVGQAVAGAALPLTGSTAPS